MEYNPTKVTIEGNKGGINGACCHYVEEHTPQIRLITAEATRHQQENNVKCVFM